MMNLKTASGICLLMLSTSAACSSTPEIAQAGAAQLDVASQATNAPTFATVPAVTSLAVPLYFSSSDSIATFEGWGIYFFDAEVYPIGSSPCAAIDNAIANIDISAPQAESLSFSTSNTVDLQLGSIPLGDNHSTFDQPTFVRAEFAQDSLYTLNENPSSVDTTGSVTITRFDSDFIDGTFTVSSHTFAGNDYDFSAVPVTVTGSFHSGVCSQVR